MDLSRVRTIFLKVYTIKILLVTAFTVVRANPSMETENTLRLELLVGEQKKISSKQEGDLFVNKKGIINIFFIGQREWLITGLNSGIVLLQCHGQRWLVEVKSTKIKKQEKIPNWICTDSQVNCQKDGHISAVLDKPNLYRKIALWCEKKSIICDLSLSASGQKSLTTKLNSALPRNYYVKVREFGLATVYFPCDESKKTDLKEKQALVKKIVKNFWNLEKLSYVCQASSLNTFIFQAKIVVMETQEAKQLGFHADSLFSLSLADPSYHISSLHHLQNLVKNKKAHVVGEPLLFVQQNQEMQVKSGGEIPVMNSDRNKNEPADLQWKTFGLDLKVKIVPLDEQQVSLTYVISLSLPKAFGGKYSFQSNNIQSCIKLDLGSPKQIAAITLSSKSQEHDYRTGFSKLPLIGPLFKVKENDYGLSKLFLWVAIAEDKK